MTNLKKISEQLEKMEKSKLDAKELMFFIYENYEFFFLNYFDEDNRYDFILSMLPLLERIVLSFDRRKASLEQYLRFIISRNKATWIRNNVINQIKEELIEREYKISLSADFVQEDEVFFDASGTEEIPNLPERLKQALPVIAYKASAYVTMEQVLKIAQISKTNAEEMFKIISTLNRRLESRIDNVKKIVQRKTSAYLKRCRCHFEQSLLEGSQSARYEYIAEKAAVNQKNYEKRLANQNYTQIVTPSWLIAEILGVSVYSIENKLRYVHKHFPEFFKKTSSQHE